MFVENTCRLLCSLAAAWAFCSPGPIHAEEPEAPILFSATLRPGIVAELNKEELLRGTVSKGFIPSAGLELSAESGRGLLAARFECSAGTAVILDALPVDSYAAAACLEAQGSLGGRSANVPALFLGASLDGAVSIHYCERLQGMHNLWLTSYGLSCIVACSWGNDEDGSLGIRLGARLLSLVSRPPESFSSLDATGKDLRLILGELHSGMFLSPPWETGRLSWAVEMRSPERRGMRGLIALEGSYGYCARPAEVMLLRQGLYLGISLSLASREAAK